MTGILERQGPNSDQIEFWNGEAARKWVDFNPLLDRMLKPLGDLAMARAAPAPGEHALDIGCGCGDAILDLAKAVAPDGAVTGLNVSAPMLAKARERAESAAVPVHIIADAPAIVDAVRAAVAPYHTGRCIELAAAVWIVSARRP